MTKKNKNIKYNGQFLKTRERYFTKRRGKYSSLSRALQVIQGHIVTFRLATQLPMRFFVIFSQRCDEWFLLKDGNC